MKNNSRPMGDQALSREQDGSVKRRERIATECVCCGCRKLSKSPAILMPFVAHRVFDWRPVEIDLSWGLRTVIDGHAYSICNSLCCDDCGLLFLDIRFSEAELVSLYNNYRDQEYTNLRDFYEPGYKDRNTSLCSGIDYIPEIEDSLSPLLPSPVRLLDWGGDTGKNTPFKKSGALIHIYDISNQPVVSGAESVDKTTALETEYDLIVCSNVLEHVPYPSDLLLDIKTVMRGHTVLYLEVPYENVIRTSLDYAGALINKRHWHEHINLALYERQWVGPPARPENEAGFLLKGCLNV